MSEDNLLIVADSERDANMLYAVGVFVADPFIYLRSGGRDSIVLADMEVDRARRLAPQCEVLSLTSYWHKLKRAGHASPKIHQVIRKVLKERKVKRVIVPESFPHGLACELKKAKLKVKVKKGRFFPEREIKREDEIQKVSAALLMAEVGLAEGIHALRNSKIGKNGGLIYRNNPLTSEKLRAIIETAILQAGGVAAHTIVASGKETCHPHEPGTGPLKAHQPIVLEVFPRSRKTGYFGDITRTVVRGRAGEGVRRLYSTVARGQQIALEMVRIGVLGGEIHRALEVFFEKEGYKTSRKNGRMEGFLHGTGHGLGLEIHESPHLGPNSADALRAGQVVTIEPGLYYRDIGGVRLEDVVVVTGRGGSNLTKFEKALEI